MVRDNSYYIRKKGLLTKRIDDEFIVIDPYTEIFLVLNETAEFIFKYLHKKRKFKELINGIRERFEVSETEATKDIIKFIELEARELILKKDS